MKYTVVVLLICLLTACNISSSGTEQTVQVPSALPLMLLTPQPTHTVPGPRIPARIENPRAGYAALIEPTGGKIEFIEIPTITAGYWNGSSPLGQQGNTVIIGFENTGVLANLRNTKVSDTLLVTDQYGLTQVYVVTQASVVDDMIAPARPTQTERLTVIGVGMQDVTFFSVVAVADSAK